MNFRSPADRSGAGDGAGGPADWPSSVSPESPDDMTPYAAAPTGRWRVLARLGLAAFVALLSAAGFVAWPELWPSDPDESVQLVNGRLTGETSGYVVQVDREARTVAVSRSAFGFHPLVLAVDRTTLITVHEREGGLGDLLEDVAVRVVYEVDGAHRVARSIEIGGSREATAPAVRRPTPVTPAPAQAVETVAEPSPPRPSAPAPTRVVDEAPPSVRPVAAEAPPAPARPAASAPPASRAAAPRPRTTLTAPVEEPPRPAAAEGDAADGTAAIDWLINSAPRR
jgi:hypothetical protein